ncbi:dipeptidase 1 isoform X2 [Aethina tumida]|uniref:dipeptidase 1 isoform X2 n=1 Tax=Aethina tumida TaxID=116153 RepID=UPI002147A652|nr:dipeptidase 1 isoform X2 [Aethina tumida]
MKSKVPQTVPDEDIPGRAALDNYPLVDGHNDLAHNLYLAFNNKLGNFDFEKNFTECPVFPKDHIKPSATDLPRLRAGKLGAQFWAAYVNCRKSKNYVIDTINQIDVIKRLIKKYPKDLQYTTTADGILEAFKQKKIASLIGVEGGHSIEDKLFLLRALYDLGARYMTLTHSCNLNWADSSIVDEPNANFEEKKLTDFGKRIVHEMNRLGMMVDLSHVSKNVMSEALNVTRAPVIFSHSSAKAVYSQARNVDDEILKRVADNQGIVMVNFYDAFIAAHNATIYDVANHINHIVDVAGVNYVGIGSDFDGVPSLPKGLEDVSKFPDLFDLLRTQNKSRWTIENLEKLAGRNLVRVFKAVERVRDELINEEPAED